MRIPLFPLNTVLFPDGRLPLRIFEVRYLDMIGRCEAEGTPFGVVCLTAGDEIRRMQGPGNGTGKSAGHFATTAFHEVGTLAHLDHVERPRPGLIGVRSRGGQRFRLQHSQQLQHGLWMGEAELIAPDTPVSIPDDLVWLSARLQQWVAQISARLTDASNDTNADGGPHAGEDPEADMPIQPPYRYMDCGWVANRFAELLPLETRAKQNLMALDNPLLRLELVSDVVEQMDSAEAAGGD